GLDTVERLVPRAREHTAFELWNPIMERNRKQALRIIRRLMEDGAEPIAVVGALGSLYRKMLLAKDLMARGAAGPEVAAATGQYGNRGGDFNGKVARVSREEIVHGIRRIAWTDDNIKNSVGRPDILVEFLVAELTLPESARWHTEFE
ncbi:MAG: DNA polymerase III subunit delta, partial [Blastocatellia bacterium]